MSEFFVGLRQPVEVRRNLLEASKGVLQALQLYEDLRDIRKEKLQVSVLFQSELKEVQSGLRKLKQILPKLPKEKKSKTVESIERDIEGIEQSLQRLKG